MDEIEILRVFAWRLLDEWPDDTEAATVDSRLPRGESIGSLVRRIAP